jgi:hypothetical protein
VTYTTYTTNRMIQIEPLSDEQWLVTVTASGTTTQHRVHVSAADAKRYGGSGSTVEKLLEASFRFLLEREQHLHPRCVRSPSHQPLFP